MRRAAIGIVLLFAACASRGKPAASQVEHRQENDAAAPATMDSDRLKADVTRQLGALRAPEAALPRLPPRAYGQCVECAEDIPYARWNAQPSAARCVACQQRHEKTYWT